MCRRKDGSEPIAFNEYSIKIRSEKSKLHARYLVIIAVSISVWLIVSGTAEKEIFTSQLSFASTITSIILSVIAIIMSISGESKTIMMQAKMEDTAKQLDVAIESMNKINAQTEKNMDELNHSIEELGRKIESMPEHIAIKTAIKMRRYNTIPTTRDRGWIENDK